MGEEHCCRQSPPSFFVIISAERSFSLELGWPWPWLFATFLHTSSASSIECSSLCPHIPFFMLTYPHTTFTPFISPHLYALTLLLSLVKSCAFNQNQFSYNYWISLLQRINYVLSNVIISIVTFFVLLCSARICYSNYVFWLRLNLLITLLISIAIGSFNYLFVTQRLKMVGKVGIKDSLRCYPSVSGQGNS